MTQRLGLARVLLHDPQVLLLDEPASGLDPRARIEIRTLLKRLGTMGKTIMVSSHILPELADICNKVGIIERGELMFNDTVAELMKQVRPHTVLNIGVAGDRDAAAKLLEGHELVERVDAGEKHLTVTLVNGQHGLQRPGDAAGDGRPQADAAHGGGAEPGDGVHGADEGNYVVSEKAERERGRQGDSDVRIAPCLPVSPSPCLSICAAGQPRFTTGHPPSTISDPADAPIV